MRCVILDLASLSPSDLDLEPLRSATDQLDCFSNTSPEQVLERLHGASIVIVNKVVLDRELLKNLPQLQHIMVAATGVNNIDLKAAHDLGISVQNCRGYGVDSVAQHCLMLMLTLSTKLLYYRAAVGRGDWSRSPHFCLLDYPVESLAGKTLGIVGYGELGQGVARLATAFGMKVMLASRPNQPVPKGRHALHDLLPQVDVLSIHCPLNKDTHNLIDWPQLCALPNSAIVINCARGGIVNEDALLKALDVGQIAGAGLDVLTEEPPSQKHVLMVEQRPNLIITPHTAWASRQARQSIVQQTAENLLAIKNSSKLLRSV